MYPRVPPGNPYGARQRRFSAPPVPRGPPRRRLPGPAIEGTRVRSSGCCSKPTTAACRRVTGRVRGSSGRMSTVAPVISAFGPFHGRQAPPLGRQRTTRRQSRPLSGPLRAFPTRGCTSGYPPGIYKVPVNAGSWCRWPHAIRHACTRTPNISPTPPLRRRCGPAQRIMASLTPIRAPSIAIPSARMVYQAPSETGPPGRFRPEALYGTEAPSEHTEHTLRLIQKATPL